MESPVLKEKYRVEEEMWKESGEDLGKYLDLIQSISKATIEERVERDSAHLNQ